mgnify:CR=1 FL=1
MGLGGFQETEQLPIFSKITKWQVQVNSPLRMAELTHRAFTIAMHERGPVQINIPRDYFYGEGDFEIQAPQKIERSAGGPESLDAAARLLAKAKFPVILAGGGVVMADGVEECKALAERLGIGQRLRLRMVRRQRRRHWLTGCCPESHLYVVSASMADS